MKLVVKGYHVLTDERVKITVYCKESIFRVAEKSWTTYLDDNFGAAPYWVDGKLQYDENDKEHHLEQIIVSTKNGFVENEDEIYPQDGNNYYHICWWANTVAGYRDVTIDFHLNHIGVTIYADDYNEANIEQED